MRQIMGIGKQISGLARISRRAIHLDRVEAQMVLQSNVLTSMSCSYAAAMAMVERDRQGAVDRMSAAISRILQTHHWLEQSLHSDAALTSALETWQRAYQKSLDIRSDLNGLNNRGVEWTGSSADGRRVRVLDALKAQSEFCDQTNNLIEGCEIAREAMESLVRDVALMVGRYKHTIAGTADRCPNANTSMFSLNGRTKAVASRLEDLANEYESKKRGGPWLAASHKVARIFYNNAVALQTVRAYPGTNIPV